MTLALPMPDHQLVAVDGRGRWCSCGAPFTLEHLGEQALVLLGASTLIPRSDWRRQRNARRYHELDYAQRRRDRKAAAESPLDRGRRVLAPLQAEWDRLAAEVDALGLQGADRLDWWAENRHRIAEAFR